MGSAMKDFASFRAGQVVWVPTSVMEAQGTKKPAEQYVECEVMQSSDETHPTVKLERTDTVVDVPMLVFKRFVEVVRPKAVV